LKFRNFNEITFEKPNIISINNSNIPLKNIEVLNMYYCRFKQFKKFTVYKLKEKEKSCKKFYD